MPLKHQRSTHNAEETRVKGQEWAVKKDSQRQATEGSENPPRAKRVSMSTPSSKEKDRSAARRDFCPRWLWRERAVRKELCRRLAGHTVAGGVQEGCCCSFYWHQHSNPSGGQDRTTLSDHSFGGQNLLLWVGGSRTDFHSKKRDVSSQSGGLDKMRRDAGFIPTSSHSKGESLQGFKFLLSIPDL